VIGPASDAAAAQNDERWIEVGIIARPHGVRGELRVSLHNKDSEVLFSVVEVLVRLPDGTEHEVSVDAARPTDQAVLLRLHSIDDRDRAEQIRGSKVLVRRSDFPELPEGEFYTCDVEGARVQIADDAASTDGRVRTIVSYPSVDVVVVDMGARGVFEVPLVADFVEKVDAKAGVVHLKTLEGLEAQP
jgi:16S rRNA processing protein RimM